MKTLDTFSKRVLVIAVSLSLVLLSLSAFLLTVQSVTAQPKQDPDFVVPTHIGLGIDTQRQVGYYLMFKRDGGGMPTVEKTPLPR